MVVLYINKEAIMQTRQLGKNGPQVSALGLGCMGMTDFYTTGGDLQEAVATVHRALEKGVTFFDTADMYGPHTNEELLGKALAGKREHAFIASKFGIVRTPGDAGARGVDGSPEYIRAAIDGTLKRLKIDTLDLYYQHRIDPNIAIEESVGAMAELVKVGKVRYLGLSEASAGTLERAHKVHPSRRCKPNIHCGAAIRRKTACSKPVVAWASRSCPTARWDADF
jgi:aryl-alcohol dehydrogenase-like predicted oxidoreductase